MKYFNPFDEHLECWGSSIPSPVRDSAIFVNDTLEIAWKSAQSVFEDKAKPEHAFEIYQAILIHKKEKLLGTEDFPENEH